MGIQSGWRAMPVGYLRRCIYIYILQFYDSDCQAPLVSISDEYTPEIQSYNCCSAGVQTEANLFGLLRSVASCRMPSVFFPHIYRPSSLCMNLLHTFLPCAIPSLSLCTSSSLPQLEILELTTLTSTSAEDFAVLHPLGSGTSGLVVAATCSRPGVPSPDKLYAVKLLYNFSHEYSSVVNNSLENEWLVLSRLLPHPNVVRFWAQFVSPIPRAFTQLLPQELRPKSVFRDRSGISRPRKGQFLVLDHHQKNLTDWTSESALPLAYDITLEMTEQILQALLYLEKNRVRHLDIKPSNILIQHENQPILCDFGCAVQFPNSSFVLEYTRGSQVGGNRGHLAPEVLSSAHRCRHDPSRRKTIDYSKQASFAAGILVCEIATGDHPLPDYPLGFTCQGVVQYATRDLLSLPEFFPKSFQSIVGDLLRSDPGKRLALEEAVKQLELCCLRRQRVSTVGDLQEELGRVKQERDIAKVRYRGETEGIYIYRERN